MWTGSLSMSLMAMQEDMIFSTSPVRASFTLAHVWSFQNAFWATKTSPTTGTASGCWCMSLQRAPDEFTNDLNLCWNIWILEMSKSSVSGHESCLIASLSATREIMAVLCIMSLVSSFPLTNSSRKILLVENWRSSTL